MTRLIAAIAAAATLAAGISGTALAGDSFGRSVAMCAQMALGQRANPPAVTCTDDGMTMTFPTFGAMVAQMRAMGC